MGDRELLGRSAGDAQLRLATGPLNSGAGFGEDGGITAGGRVHNHDDPPLWGGGGGLHGTEDGERQKPREREDTVGHTNERTTYD